MKMPAQDTADMNSLYGEGEGESQGNESTQSVDQEEAQAANKTGTVSLKVLQGNYDEPPKEGEVVRLKVQKIYGDTAEVVCSDIGGGGPSYEDRVGGKEEGEGTPAEEQSPNEELDQMSAAEEAPRSNY